jgi:hypothetical protein
MKELVTSVDIDAPAETVWDVLVDFESYPEWNPRTRITGTAAEGERLVVAPGPAAEGMPTFRPTVLRADGTELRWLGHLYVRGLFDGEHVFAVEDLGDGRSRFTQSESFRGLLVRPLVRLYGEDTESGFHAVNAALKARSESIAARPASESPAYRPSVEGDGHSAEASVDTAA